MNDRMCLFAVTFDKECKPINCQLTRDLPARAAANPEAFFAAEGYSPGADQKQSLAQDRSWQFSVEGYVTVVLVGKAEDGKIEVRDEVRILRYGSRRVNGVRTPISDAMMDELRQEATERVYRALDMREEVTEMLPDLKGLVRVLPPKDIMDAARPPLGWTQRKERMFQRWVANGKPGMFHHDAVPIDPEIKMNMERAIFNSAMEQIELEDAIKSAIHTSKGVN